MKWFGVMPAMTTPFDADLAVDHVFLARHAKWLLENGCTGLVTPGSLGEGATLGHAEKIEVLKTVVKASQDTETPVVAAVSALLTKDGVRKAKKAGELGCSGVKESSGDGRRVMAIRKVLGERLQICVGVDDVVVEAVNSGATGWIAGLVNSFPAESVELFKLAYEGRFEDAFPLYRWYLPLLRMD